ncbi:MAG: hypothetical protein WC400_00205 [Patescibacteria group bacterium]|jgi:hypothetical protein
MSGPLDPNDFLTELGIPPTPTDPTPPHRGDDPEEFLTKSLGLPSQATAAEAATTQPLRAERRIATPAPTPESGSARATLAEQFGETHKQSHPFACVVACWMNARQYVFAEKGLENPDGRKLLEDTLLKMAERHGFDEKSGIKLNQAGQLIKENGYFAETTTDPISAHEHIKQGRALIILVDGGLDSQGHPLKHGVLIHMAKDPATGKQVILMRDPRLQPDPTKPGIKQLTLAELDTLLSPQTKKGKGKAEPNPVLVIGPKGFKKDQQSSVAEMPDSKDKKQLQEASEKIERNVDELRKKMLGIDPESRSYEKYREHPADRLRLLMETFRPRANSANRRLNAAYNSSWEQMFKMELYGSADGSYKGVLSGLELDLKMIEARIRTEAQTTGESVSEKELEMRIKTTWEENLLTAHERIDRIERRYLGEAIFLSEQFTDSKMEDAAYVASLKQTAQHALGNAWRILSDRQLPLLVDWQMTPIRLGEVRKNMEYAFGQSRHSADIVREEDKETETTTNNKLLQILDSAIAKLRESTPGAIDSVMEQLDKLPINLLISREGRLARAWSLFWWAKGLYKIAKRYSRRHGIDLADTRLYESDGSTRQPIGVWREVQDLRLEYYLSGGGVELWGDIGQEQEVLKVQIDFVEQYWPTGSNPEAGTLKDLVNQRLGGLAGNGEEPPEMVTTAYSDLEGIIGEYGKIGTRLRILGEQLSDPILAGSDVKLIERVREFSRLQEEMFTLKHRALIDISRLNAFL